MKTAKQLRAEIEAKLSTYDNLYSSIELAMATAIATETFNFELHIRASEKDEAIKYLTKHEYSVESLESVESGGYFITITF